MSSASSKKRVSYLLSPSLVQASDDLPSNLGRSTTVHSLVSHLDLLDLESQDHSKLGEEEGEDPEAFREDEPDQEELNQKQLRSLFGLTFEINGTETQELNRATILPPREATDKELKVYHSSTYIESLLDQQRNANPSFSKISENKIKDEEEEENDWKEDERRRKRVKVEKKGDEQRRLSDEGFGLTDDNPRFSSLEAHVRLIAGAALVAAEELIKDRADVAIVWDGGRHHAKRGTASGFCYINDAVLAILALRKPRLVKLPVHQPDSPSTSITTPSETSTSNVLGFGTRPSEIQAAADLTQEEEIQDYEAPSSTSNPRPISHKLNPKNSKPKTVLKQSKVLYLDLDLHWGDGVEEALFNSSSVLTLSIHMFAPGFFPCGLSTRPNTAPSSSTSSSEAGSSQEESSKVSHPAGSLHGPSGPPTPDSAAHSALSLPLKPGAGPETLSRIMKSCVEPLAKAYAPDYIVIQAGCDALKGDPTSTFNYSSTSILAAVSTVLSWNVPTLILGGGGYNTSNAAKCWSSLTALSLGRWKFDHEKKNDPEEENKDLGLFDNKTLIPESDSKHWETYAPDFNLGVAEGSTRDENDEEYLLEVEKVFQEHVDHWKSSKL